MKEILPSEVELQSIFFHRDVPRISVDIDLVYLPILDRTSSLNAIGNCLAGIKRRLEAQHPDYQIREKRTAGFPVSLYVTRGTTVVKIEANTILRGCIHPAEQRDVSRSVAEKLRIDVFTTARTLSFPDLYGGKICAALDRQHPRDLFDIMVLLDNEGITEDTRKAFGVYLACHDRPMNELLGKGV